MKKENDTKPENSEKTEILKDYGQVGRIIKIDLSSNGTDIFGGGTQKH